jgi:hypothetical protein
VLDKFVGDASTAVCLIDDDVLQISATSIMAAHCTAYDSLGVDTQEAHARITCEVAFRGWSRIGIADRNAGRAMHHRHDIVVAVDRVRADFHGRDW